MIPIYRCTASMARVITKLSDGLDADVPPTSSLQVKLSYSNYLEHDGQLSAKRSETQGIKVGSGEQR